LFGAFSAFANSTAFNGYVQSSGNTGIDFASIDGGSYRVTVTRAGHLNFRYVIGGQVFDSNAEASVLDMVSHSDAWWTNSSAQGAYTAASVSHDEPVLGSTSYSSYIPGAAFYAASALAQSSSSSDPLVLQSGSSGIASSAIGSGAITYSDGTASNFYVAPQTAPQAFQIAGTSMIALVGNDNANLFYGSNDWFVTQQQEVPEPATFALLAGGLLLGALIRHRLTA